jgi:hypothetical protein
VTVPVASAVASNEIHVIALTVNAVPHTPTVSGYTNLIADTEPNGTSNMGHSVWYKVGPISAGTNVTCSVAGVTRARIAAVSFKITGANTAAPFSEGSGVTAQSLIANGGSVTAPTRTAVNSRFLITTFGVRTSDSTGATGGIAASGGGLTEIDDIQSSVGTGFSSVITEAAYLVLSGAGATGTKTVVSSLAGYPVGSSFLVSPGANTAPATPTIDTVTPAATQNTVAWTAPDNGGSAITDYDLQRQVYQADGVTVATAWASIGAATINGSSTSYTDTGLTNGTIYGYRLSATNAVGTSAFSGEKKGTPAAGGGAGTGFIGYLQTKFGSALLHYWPLNDVYQAQDVIGDADGTVNGTVSFTSTGAVFSGSSGNYILVADRADLSVRNQASKSMGQFHGMSVSNWSTTDNLRSLSDQGGYCHYMGKGASGQHEYTWRYYSDRTTDPSWTRQKRTSLYHYRLSGDLGTGSYIQDNPGTNVEQVMFGNWDLNFTSDSQANTFWDGSSANGFGSSFPGGTFIGKAGVARECDGFTSGGGGTNIYPDDGTAPFTIGCRYDRDSWIRGKIRRVAHFNRKLTKAEIADINANWALAEGTPGGGNQNTAPTAVLNLAAVRTADPSVVTVSWAAPTSNGGAAIDGYRVSWVSGSQTFTTPSLVTSPYTAIAVPSGATTFTVEAHNSQGYGPGTNFTVPVAATLQLIGTLTDDFNSPTAGLDWTKGTGVAENASTGQLEWSTIDSTPRGAYIRGDFRSQSAWFTVTPSTASNTVTAMFVRSTTDPTRTMKIAYLNGTIQVIVTDGAADSTPFSRIYSSSTDKYWRVLDTGSTISFQYSADGTDWLNLRTGVARPAWLNDVQVGIEAYTGTSV